jgi:hypothetical protein
MLFGSAVVVAILISGSGESQSKRSKTHLWLSSEERPTPAKFEAKKIPLELKSIKAVGASGLGLFVPLCDHFSIGVGVSTFKVAPEQRATQFVAAIRFRF